MIETERLIIDLASDDTLRQLIEKETNPELKKAYSEMLDGCLNHPDCREWYALWIMELKTEKGRIGDLCFKGLPSDGVIEVGYGMLPTYEHQGYMTEAVSAVVRWAILQPGVVQIEVETAPDNIQSQRVLQKSGFVPNGLMGEEGPRFVWVKPLRMEDSSNHLIKK